MLVEHRTNEEGLKLVRAAIYDGHISRRVGVAPDSNTRLLTIHPPVAFANTLTPGAQSNMNDPVTVLALTDLFGAPTGPAWGLVSETPVVVATAGVLGPVNKRVADRKVAVGVADRGVRWLAGDSGCHTGHNIDINVGLRSVLLLPNWPHHAAQLATEP